MFGIDVYEEFTALGCSGDAAKHMVEVAQFL
jgi:hypothetical protein